MYHYNCLWSPKGWEWMPKPNGSCPYRSDTNWPGSGGERPWRMTWSGLRVTGDRRSKAFDDLRILSRHTWRTRLAFAASLLRTVVDGARQSFAFVVTRVSSKRIQRAVPIAAQSLSSSSSIYFSKQRQTSVQQNGTAEYCGTDRLFPALISDLNTMKVKKYTKQTKN